MNKYKYITVLHITGKSVPFSIMPNGEIKIDSLNPLETEDTCYVILGNIFYEHSLDYNRVYGKM